VDVLRDRVERLPDGAREFLRLLAICGRPMAPEVVHCCRRPRGRRTAARLSVAREPPRPEQRVRGARRELYHDRIRETLAAIVPPDEKRRLHGRVAETLVARGPADPEAL
jgi:predicted ATPase